MKNITTSITNPKEKNMFKIVEKVKLTTTQTKMVIEAPFVAKKAEPGQFIILRVDERKG